MKNFVVLLVCALTFSANAAVIDIIDMGDGLFNITSDGTPYGSGMSRSAAEKVAQKLGGQGNTINWKTRAAQPSAATYNPARALPGGNAQKALPPHNSNLPATTSKPGTNLPATTAKPGSNLPATTAQPGTNLPTTTGGGGGVTPPKQEPVPKPAPAPKPGVNVGGVAMGAIGVVTGAVGLYDSVKSKETKATWGDVGQGALSGATTAAGAAAIVNAIPVGGQIAYGVSMAVGTVIGASGAAAKMFSETDCEMDPVTGQYACCNVSKLTNIQARYCNIGDEMFATFPHVRTCMQGKNKFESNWFKARFLDDHWSKEGEVKFCSGYVMPEDGDYKIQAYGSSEAAGKVCWQWECADAGFVRRGGKCVALNGGASGGGSANASAVGGELPAAVVTASAIKAGDPCPAERLPQYATAGKYIKNGRNEQTGLDKFVCAATACKPGTYLVKNERGESQGWCRAGTEPAPVATAVDNGNENTTPSGDEGAENSAPIVNDDAAAADNSVAAQPAFVSAPAVVQTPCELGMQGYVIYNGKCITEYEYSEIQRAAKAAAQRASSQDIANAAAKINGIKSSFKKTVWKNEEGKFNTSRLVSDSVAGIVLGTAGGLITSSVIKKNQIKSGFEDIKCTIGGQTVAEYGDEFRVGVK